MTVKQYSARLIRRSIDTLTATAVSRSSNPVVCFHHALVMGAIRAAEEPAFRFDAVTDDPAAAMFTFRGERMNRAFETVKVMRLPVRPDFHELVVVVAANFAFHKCSLLQRLITGSRT